MSFEPKDNSGALFKNERKESETHADYRGDARIDGNDVWVNAWVNKSKDGKSYMKLTFKRKDGGAEKPVAKSGAATSFAHDLDDVPFGAEFR